MKILILVVYYLPSTVSCAKLIKDLSSELFRLGHSVSIIAPDEKILTDLQISNEEGIRIVRVRSGKIRTASKPVRMINECRLSWTIWNKGQQFFRKNPCDLIIYYSPTIFFGPLVKRLKKLYSCPSYLILRDIFPQWALDAGVLKEGFLYNYFKWMERINYEAADYIGVEAPGNLLYFSTKGQDKKNQLEVLYNWTTLGGDKKVVSNFRSCLGLQDKVVFFYGGNIGVAQDIDNIIRLAYNLKDEPDAYFLLVGDGSEVDRLNSIINKEGLTNIKIHPAVEQELYPSMLAEFDVGLITLNRNLKTYNFPGKMLGYMYYAKPILASINPGNDLKALLEAHQAGLVCINGDDCQLLDCVRLLLRDAHLRQKMGANARRLLESTFSVSTAASLILSHFN
jgi:O26-antigen biosynthesis N-acetyl-L-fucosamine transferase